MAYEVDDRAVHALRRSHRALSRAEILDVNGDVLTTLDLSAGQVTAERERANRRSGSCTIIDRYGTLTPRDAEDLLAPYGNEIALWRGWELFSGSGFSAGVNEVWVPLGVFGYREVSIRDSRDGVQMSANLTDRSARITAARWEDWVKIARDVEISTKIIELAQDRWAPVEYDLPITDYSTVRAFLSPGADSDPWKDLQDFALAAGETLAFGVDGILRYDPSDQVEPVRTYTDGEEAALIDLERTMSSEGTFNVVVASSAGADVTTPVRSSVEDDDEQSPTYTGGSFGRHPTFITSPMLRTVNQCTKAAKRELDLRKGLASSITFEALVDPTLDVGDLVQVTRPASRTDVWVAIDSLTIPLAASGTMSIGGRVVKEVSNS